MDSGAGSKIDLADSKAIVNYTGVTPAATIRALLMTGRGTGSWDGEGINSSTAATIAADNSNVHKTAIGYGEASTLGLSSFAGQSVDGTTIVMRYTYLGDANLDGRVNALDFNALASNFGPTAGKVWTQADFNFDGITNSSDFGVLATNFNLALPGPSIGSVIPEAGIGWSLLGLVLFRSRRTSVL
jgi:hypothetical protein